MDHAGDALRSTWPGSGRQLGRRWEKLSEADVASIGGSFQHLVSRLQERYGYSRDRAEREAQEFIDELEAAITPRRPHVPPERTMPSGNARAPGSPAPQSRTSHAGGTWSADGDSRGSAGGPEGA